MPDDRLAPLRRGLLVRRRSPATRLGRWYRAPEEKALTEAAAALPERLADRYSLLEPIGQGGMGRVVRAHDELLGRDVAVKILFGADGVDVARAFTKEARAGAAVAHPGIAAVYDAGVQDGLGYVVMELVRGQTLREILRQRGALPLDEAVAIGARLAEALDAAHALGVVHCDVTPRNVIVTPDGTPRLIDFGIARAASVTNTLGPAEIRGTAPYIAPEQLTGGTVDGRTDIYALGAIVYEMLTGSPPFDGANAAAVAAQRLHADPRPPRELNPTIPPPLERAVLTALARDPAHRYARASAFASALRAAPAEAPTRPFATVPIERTTPMDGSTASTADWTPRSSGRDRAAWTSRASAGGRAGWPLHPGVLLALGAALLLGLVLLTQTLRPGAATSGPAGSATPLASGAAVVVPDLVGKHLVDLPPTLQRAHLRAGAIETRPVEAARVGTVIEQSPPAGQSSPANSVVRLVVGVPR